MAKKATTPAPEASEKVSEEVVTSTVPETSETEATTSAAIDQPAVSDDASASSSSPAEETAVEPAEPATESAEPEASSSPAVIEEPATHKPGGGFDSSPFAEPAPALTMIQRIEALEARVLLLEG